MINNSKANKLFLWLLLIILTYLMFENYLIVTLKTENLNALYFSFSIIKLLLLYGSLFGLIFLGLLKKSFTKKAISLVGLLYLLFILLLGVLNNNSISSIAASFQNIYLWLFVLFLLYVLAPKPDFAFYKASIFIIVLALMVHFIYSIHVMSFFEGDYNDFYFYELYDRLGMFGYWNHIKNGTVRAYGFFGSSTGLSQVLITPISFFVVFVANSKNKQKVFGVVFLIVFTVFLYLAKIRNPILAIGFAFLFYLLSKRVPAGHNKKLFVYFILLYAFSFSVVSIVALFGFGDLSSQARIPMLLKFWNNLMLSPMGYGVGSTGNAIGYKYFYESSFATIVSDLGLVFSLPYFGFILHLVFKFHFISKLNSGVRRIASESALFLLISLLFLTNFSNIFDATLYIHVIYIYACFFVLKEGSNNDLKMKVF